MQFVNEQLNEQNYDMIRAIDCELQCMEKKNMETDNFIKVRDFLDSWFV